MHCGRVSCGLDQRCTASAAAPVSREACGGRSGTHGATMAMAMARSRRRVTVCEGNSTSSRRVSYKRRQHPPLKGFPTTHEQPDMTVFDKPQQDLQKTRALEYFLCESDETSTSASDTTFHSLVSHDDASWSSRIVTQVKVDIMWLSLHSSALRVPRRRSRSGYYDDASEGVGVAENTLAEQALRAVGGLDFFQWLERLKETYGASFMALVVLGYCTQGFRCFPWLAMSYFFKDNLQVDPGTMQFLMSTTMLPMLAKPVYGVISDSVYIQGAHRIPYLIIAGALQVVAWGAIVMHPGASSSVAVLTGVLTMSNMGAAISEVTNDALVAEAVKSKQGARQGELQSLAWLALATGGLFGNLMGGFALQRMDVTTMFSIFMLLVGTQLLLCTTISEATFGLAQKPEAAPLRISSQEKTLLLPQTTKRIYSRFGYTTDSVEISSPPRPVGLSPSPTPLGIQGQLTLLSGMLQNPSVWRPLLWFLTSYAVIPNLGSSMFFYQTQYLGLDSSVIGLVKVVGQTGLLAASMLYNRKLKKLPLRKLFLGTQILLAGCMLSDVVLVERLNLQLGIPDEVFVLGASAFVEAIAQFKILPFMVLLAQLCPDGSEGSLLALFMSAQCLAGLMSAYFGVGLASWLHISANSFDELPVGIVVQAAFALLPVLWINFIPQEEEEQTTTTGKKNQ